ncbi:hypothetical protein [Gloeothece verrucosa]|uniref:Uncharacterized protein n=1 Tax=Gloeothece verrucosa (strain PCC 7822) TaxID=497965 RepID=E0UMQ5_GLOV7|nr:hypothetical protein [Gloeothece verrucosa]ADN18235.1 hypothetical protein Cyan7822_6452 [Gloeothece verrucosa PCC 7822]
MLTVLSPTSINSERDYLVVLSSSSSQRRVSVTWDEGVEIDWVDWLEAYNQFESEKFELVEII